MVEGATDEVAAGGVVVVADADDAVSYGAVGGEPVDSLIGASCVDASFEPQPTVSQPIAAIMISARGVEPYGLTKNASPTLSPPIALFRAKLHRRSNAVRCRCLARSAAGYERPMADARSMGERKVAARALVLGGRYSLTNRIAVGGMGEVWAARDLVLGREVAVKVLRDELVESTEFLERFRDEARHTAALIHPGITSVFDYGEGQIDGVHKAFLVMELVHGESLSQVLARSGSLDTATVLSVLLQSAEALHAAHQNGVVHRDVKPGNLLVRHDGTVKLTDFGIARAMNAVALTEVGKVVGTAQYMSPEQAQGREATPASDVYSLAVIGYEMLTGRPPFTGANPAALAMAHVSELPPPLPSTVSTGLRALIERSLAKNPDDRPRDAHQFAREVRNLQRTSTSAVAATRVMERVSPPATVVMPVASTPHRNRVPVLFALLVVALIGFAAFVSSRSTNDPLPVDGTVQATTPPTASTDAGPQVATTIVPATEPPTSVVSSTVGGKTKGSGKGKGKP